MELQLKLMYEPEGDFPEAGPSPVRCPEMSTGCLPCCRSPLRGPPHQSFVTATHSCCCPIRPPKHWCLCTALSLISVPCLLTLFSQYSSCFLYL